jgi:protein translocase SecG subunit
LSSIYFEALIIGKIPCIVAFLAISVILNLVSPMHAVLHTMQIVSSLVLIALVLLQRTTGDMGSVFGDTSFFQTRRGSERFFFVFTVVIAAVFAFSSIGVLVA